MSARTRIPPGLPEELSASDKPYALYEDVEYSEYWADPAKTNHDVLEQYLIADLLPDRGTRIIDIGCGYGRLAPCYLDRFDSTVLYDGSMSLLQRARELLGDRVILIAGDMLRIPFKPASFDQALCVRVLQHLHDPHEALAEARRILSGHASYIFSYHNKRNMNRILRYFESRRTADPFSLESAEVSPTLISHHPARISAMLEEADFSPPEYRSAVVIDAIARLTAKLGRQAPSGLRWASFVGRHRLAPWLLGRTSPEHGDVLRSAASIDELFECPACRGDVARSAETLQCTACKRAFPIRDGIADFRL